MSLGVPLPKGAAYVADELALRDAGGDAVRSQGRALGRWPDGSLKWVLVDWVDCGADVLISTGAGESRGDPSADEDLLRVSERDACVSVATRHGTTTYQIGDELRQAFECRVLTGSKRLRLIIDGLEVVDQGPVRAGLKMSGRCVDAAGKSELNWKAQVDYWAHADLERWRLTLHNPRAAKHPGGVWELGDEGSVFLQQASLRITAGERADGVDVSLGPDGPAHCSERIALKQHSSGGAAWNSGNHVDRTGRVNLDRRGYSLDLGRSGVEGLRADPIVRLQKNGGAILGVYLESFWQSFPKELVAEGDGVTLALFPETTDELHELQGGEQKTHAFWIARGDVAAPGGLLDAARRPPRARVSPDAIASTGAVRHLTPLGLESNQDYSSLVDSAVEGKNSFFEKREAIDEYGWRHFGDVYGDHEAAFSDPEPPLVSHWNNQYDLVHGLGVRYLRGGDQRWFELMQDMAWHVADIDIYHTDEDKLAYNHGLFWHTVHYVDAGKANHRSYPTGTVGGGPCAEHAYARGLLLYYYLTGSEAIRDAVVELGDWVLAIEDGSKTPFRWLSSAPTGLSSASGVPTYQGPGRGPGNASETLLAAFEMTEERKYLERVEELMRRVVSPADDLESLNLLDAEWRWYYNLYLQALGRYLEIKAERGECDEHYAYGRACLLHYAGWMADHEYPYLQKPEILEYPTETWAAQDMRKSEVFHYASRHVDESLRERYLERAAYFFDESVSTLTKMPTAHFCRPVALLLGCGYSYDWFRSHADASPLPQGPSVVVAPRKAFVPQKQQALRRAKMLAPAVAATFALAAGIALFAMLG